jgi:hypothetical protein
MFSTGIKAAAVATTMMGAMFFAKPAQASDFSFNLNVGRPTPVVYHDTRPVVRPVIVPVTQRRWIPEQVVTRTEQVLVSPEHVDRVWVPEKVETHRDRDGRIHTIVTPGFYKDVVCPAKYETRTVSTVIPGRWELIPVVADHCAPAPAPIYYGHNHNDRHDRNDRNDRWDRNDRRDNDRRDNDRRDNDRDVRVQYSRPGTSIAVSGYSTTRR